MLTNVRQTVQFGPVDTSGNPTFFPATSASLGITTQNISATVPIVLSAAQGFYNIAYQSVTNLTWSGLTASNTNYLYVNALTGVTGSTTLVPIYQYGGTPSVTSGQFTFNISEMTGYMGNGSTAPATPIVFVGEVVTAVGTVTSTIAYAYNGYFDSGFTATLPAVSTQTTVNSNLGFLDAIISFSITNTTTEAGFSVNDQVPIASTAFLGTNNVGTNLWSSRTTAGLSTSSTSGWKITPKGGGSTVTLTNANWKYKLIAKRGW